MRVCVLGWVAPCRGDWVAFKEKGKGTASQFPQRVCGQDKHGVCSGLKTYSEEKRKNTRLGHREPREKSSKERGENPRRLEKLSETWSALVSLLLTSLESLP